MDRQVKTKLLLYYSGKKELQTTTAVSGVRGQIYRITGVAKIINRFVNMRDNAFIFAQSRSIGTRY